MQPRGHVARGERRHATSIDALYQRSEREAHRVVQPRIRLGPRGHDWQRHAERARHELAGFAIVGVEDLGVGEVLRCAGLTSGEPLEDLGLRPSDPGGSDRPSRSGER